MAHLFIAIPTQLDRSKHVTLHPLWHTCSLRYQLNWTAQSMLHFTLCGTPVHCDTNSIGPFKACYTSPSVAHLFIAYQLNWTAQSVLHFTLCGTPVHCDTNSIGPLKACYTSPSVAHLFIAIPTQLDRSKHVTLHPLWHTCSLRYQLNWTAQSMLHFTLCGTPVHCDTNSIGPLKACYTSPSVAHLFNAIPTQLDCSKHVTRHPLWHTCSLRYQLNWTAQSVLHVTLCDTPVHCDTNSILGSNYPCCDYCVKTIQNLSKTTRGVRI